MKKPTPEIRPGDRVSRAEPIVFLSLSDTLARGLNRGVVTGIWWGRWADGSLDAVSGEACKWWVAVDRVGGGTEESPADAWTKLDAVSALAALA